MMASAQLSATIDYSGTAADGEFVYHGADGPTPALSATAYVYDAIPEPVRPCRAPRATYTPAGGAHFLSAAGVRDAGKEADQETGLGYFGARYYSGAQGRFTTPDPLLNSGRPWLPQSWNRYVYSLNNPLRFVDPNGLWERDSKCKKGDAACEGNRQKFRDGVQQLRDALGKTKEGSDAYNALNKALGKIGTEGDGNNVLVAFSSKQSDPGDTRPTLGGNIRMTFGRSSRGEWSLCAGQNPTLKL